MAEAIAGSLLRFAVADRVRCKTSATRWSRGHTVQLQYREDEWPPNVVAPYQIQLDDGRLIYCPEDSDCLIQAVRDNNEGKEDCPAEILVCQAGACRRMGSEALLHEIEELANSAGGAVVRSTGCLGNCRQAPNAVVTTYSGERLFARIRSLPCSAKVVEHACGRMPDLKDDELVGKLQRARRVRVRPGKPVQIQQFAEWCLESIHPVSKCSAVYRFRSDDTARGTVFVTGRGGRTVWSKTWHTTLLAEVGKESNREGTLALIERDYTPISTAKEWAAGQVDLLVKIYPDGAATSWLHRVATRSMAGGGGGAAARSLKVRLSRPMKTLHVPSLSADEDQINRRPDAGVLLLLAGTGIVAAPQVLHHTDATTCFGKQPPLRRNVRVMYSCRIDDALMIPELKGWCQNKSLENCIVFVTESQLQATGPPPPFPDAPDTDVAAAFAELDNATCVRGRLSLELLQAELDSIKSPVGKPRRIVVSGPSGFNKVVEQMLDQCGVEGEAITVLEA